jgi:hypothetical protein
MMVYSRTSTPITWSLGASCILRYLRGLGRTSNSSDYKFFELQMSSFLDLSSSMRLPFEKEISRAAFSDILNGTVRSLHLHGVVHMAKITSEE